MWIRCTGCVNLPSQAVPWLSLGCWGWGCWDTFSYLADVNMSKYCHGAIRSFVIFWTTWTILNLKPVFVSRIYSETLFSLVRHVCTLYLSSIQGDTWHCAKSPIARPKRDFCFLSQREVLHNVMCHPVGLRRVRRPPDGFLQNGGLLRDDRHRQAQHWRRLRVLHRPLPALRLGDRTRQDQRATRDCQPGTSLKFNTLPKS